MKNSKSHLRHQLFRAEETIKSSQRGLDYFKDTVDNLRSQRGDLEKRNGQLREAGTAVRRYLTDMAAVIDAEADELTVKNGADVEAAVVMRGEAARLRWHRDTLSPENGDLYDGLMAMRSIYGTTSSVD